MIQQFRIAQSRRAQGFGLLEIYIRCNNFLEDTVGPTLVWMVAAGRLKYTPQQQMTSPKSNRMRETK